MRIALVVHSKTGNTLSVSEKLKEILLKRGHEVTIFPLSPLNPDVSKVSELTLPQLKQWDSWVIKRQSVSSRRV